MRSRRLRRAKTGGPRNHHGTQRTHRNTIQIVKCVHNRCCPRTKCGSGRVCHPPMQQQPEETQRKLLLIAKPRSTGEISDLRAQGIVYRPLAWTADGRAHTHQSPEPYGTQQTSRHAATDSKCQHRWKHEIQTALLRRRAAMTHFSLVAWTEPPATGSEHTTKTQTQERTPQHQTMTMTTPLPSPARKLQPSIRQASKRSPFAPVVGLHAPRLTSTRWSLEDLVEDKSVSF